METTFRNTFRINYRESSIVFEISFSLLKNIILKKQAEAVVTARVCLLFIFRSKENTISGWRWILSTREKQEFIHIETRFSLSIFKSLEKKRKKKKKKGEYKKSIKKNYCIQFQRISVVKMATLQLPREQDTKNISRVNLPRGNYSPLSLDHLAHFAGQF